VVRIDAARMAADLDPHLDIVYPKLRAGKAIPLLGAGANRCRSDPPPALERVPDGRELAGHLAKAAGYPANEPLDLLRVSQYVAVTQGMGALYQELHDVFDRAYGPNRLHGLLARLPAARRANGLSPGGMVITTNYDDMLEVALAAAGEPYDVLSYIADGDDAGLFMHRTSEGAAAVVKIANEYRGLALRDRTVVVKLHGAVERNDPLQDSYVVTEDDYIEYLTRSDDSTLLPVTLSAAMSQSHFLFLGYSLRDWNLRVILHRIWTRQRRAYHSWAVQLSPDALDSAFWQDRKVEIRDVEIDVYVDGLIARLEADLDGAG
jgi:hypothetical protein